MWLLIELGCRPPPQTHNSRTVRNGFLAIKLTAATIINPIKPKIWNSSPIIQAMQLHIEAMEGGMESSSFSTPSDSSGNNPLNPQRLQSTLSELEKRIKAMQTLIQEEDDGASFTQRAEMYYQKRPQLMENMEELQRAYSNLEEYSTQALSRSSLSETLDKSPSGDLENKISTDEMPEDSWMTSTSELNRLVEENCQLLLEMTRSNEEKREEKRELVGLVEKLMREKETLLEQQSKLMDENWALSLMLQKLPNASTSQLAKLKTLILTKLGGD